jgi:hypothetical protein
MKENKSVRNIDQLALRFAIEIAIPKNTQIKIFA